jgi:4-amino-4-deoxy-L-arabinose transferase-like glycosyltransferase
MTKLQKLIFAAIIFLSIFFRYYQIMQMPGGLFPDEAANGLDINLMQQGQLQPFYERGNGREALFFYMEWGSTELFGKGQWEFHATSAAVGVLAVVVCFLVSRRIFLFNDKPAEERRKKRATNIALLAAFLMSVSTWHVVLSRTALRANLIPLMAGLTIYFLLGAYQATTKKSKIWMSLFAGAAFALGFYTYIAFRITVPFLLVILIWPLLAQIRQRAFWQTIKKYFASAVLFLVAFAIVIFPIAKYFYQHPGSFVGRAGQVSIFNPELYTVDSVQLHGKPPVLVVLSALVEVTKTQVMGFFTRGDLNWRQNISGLPMLSPLFSPFFAVGLILVTWFALRYLFAPNKQSRNWKFFLLAGWFWAMLLPVVTTAEGIPHGLRGIGMIPSVFIISAWALYEFGALIAKWRKKIFEQYEGLQSRAYKLGVWGLKLVVFIFAVALVSQTYFLYFVYAANSPEYFYAFRADLTPVSQYLRERCDKDHTYLVLDGYSVQTTDYLTSDPKGDFYNQCNVPYRQVDPENSWKLSGLMTGDEVVFTQSSVFDTKKFKQYHPKARLKEEIRNKFGQSVMAVYEIN